ncbi:MAG: 23S rRNA pseudouridine(2605) synthase RluB [Gammaproteobacteria bacterium]|nr:23S rRNA pseudouridine(2605) synthase RluB [Gammaproteobacteria bacterium]
MSEKLQKVLARAGLGSRREMETWIEAGRVSINGQIANLGARVIDDDKIRVDGHLLKSSQTQAQRLRILMYHKPSGEICSRNDPEGRNTIFDHLPNLRNGRWVAIGRLDFNTSGLMLLTNDGEVANQLMHPSKEFEREYAVRIKGIVTDEILKRLKDGVELEDGPARFEKVVDAGGEGSNHWYHVVLREGRNREVRRMWESQELVVSRLIRVRFGPITLPRNLPHGRWREVEGKELKQLLNALGMEDKAKDVKTTYDKRRGNKVPRTSRRVKAKR